MDTKATISAAPKELTDRQLVNTPIGPVCMSRTEYAMYQEQLEIEQARRAFAAKPKQEGK